MADNEASSVYSLQSLSHAQLINTTTNDNANNTNNQFSAFNKSTGITQSSENFNLHYIKHKTQLITILNEKNLHSHLGLCFL